MKLLPILIFTLSVLGCVVAQTATTPTPTTHPTRMERDIDPIYAEYERKAYDLYIKALIDYYHAHPDRLESDLSGLTSVEYSSMVPSEVLDELHVDRAKIEAQIKENDDKLLNEMDEAEETPEAADQHDMETEAVHDHEADTDMETSQFGRFGRLGGFGRFGGFGGRFGGFGVGRFGFGRFGFPGFGFGRFGGFGFGGYPSYGYGYGSGYPGYGYGFGYPGYGFGFRRLGFGLGFRRFGFI